MFWCYLNVSALFYFELILHLVKFYACDTWLCNVVDLNFIDCLGCFKFMFACSTNTVVTCYITNYLPSDNDNDYPHLTLMMMMASKSIHFWFEANFCFLEKWWKTLNIIFCFSIIFFRHTLILHYLFILCFNYIFVSIQSSL